jgi:hypothetical protein
MPNLLLGILIVGAGALLTGSLTLTATITNPLLFWGAFAILYVATARLSYGVAKLRHRRDAHLMLSLVEQTGRARDPHPDSHTRVLAPRDLTLDSLEDILGTPTQTARHRQADREAPDARRQAERRQAVEDLPAGQEGLLLPRDPERP